MFSFVRKSLAFVLFVCLSICFVNLFFLQSHEAFLWFPFPTPLCLAVIVVAVCSCFVWPCCCVLLLVSTIEGWDGAAGVLGLAKYPNKTCLPLGLVTDANRSGERAESPCQPIDFPHRARIICCHFAI